MKSVLLLILICVAINCLGQVKFDDGYFIDNHGHRIDCLIKDWDWKRSPQFFKYKMEKSDKAVVFPADSVRELAIDGGAKYYRVNVAVDLSTDIVDDMDNIRGLNHENRNVTLKVLVEGKASLFIYRKNKLVKYFYQKGRGNIKQLGYKRYRTINEDIGVNEEFKKQLDEVLNCPKITRTDIAALKYEKDDLVAIFAKYNECVHSEYIDFENQNKEAYFSLTPKFHLRNTSVSMFNPVRTIGELDFGSSLSYAFGMELEFKLPWNKRKWSIILEPTYQTFNKDLKHPVFGSTTREYTTTVDYSSLELPIYIRHYFYLNDDSKLFLNGGLILDKPLNGKIEYNKLPDNPVRVLDIDGTSSFLIGAGYKMKSKIGIELRYLTNRSLLRDYTFWSADHSTLSLVLGYTIF